MMYLIIKIVDVLIRDYWCLDIVHLAPLAKKMQKYEKK